MVRVLQLVMYALSAAFISAGWGVYISWSKCWLYMCIGLDGNKDGTNRNCCTHRLV